MPAICVGVVSIGAARCERLVPARGRGQVEDYAAVQGNERGVERWLAPVLNDDPSALAEAAAAE